jgi:hypothetical protein
VLKLDWKPTISLADCIVLAIIAGAIAISTISKIPSDNISGIDTTISKETAGMISNAFTAYQEKRNKNINSHIQIDDLLPYFPYIKKVDIKSAYQAGRSPRRYNIRSKYLGEPLQTCSTQLPCLILHNGSVLQYDAEQNCPGLQPENEALLFNLDPDGNGPDGKVTFLQYLTGRLRTGGHADEKNALIQCQSHLIIQNRDPDYIKDWY